MFLAGEWGVFVPQMPVEVTPSHGIVLNQYPTLLSHWLGEAQGKRGLHVTVAVNLVGGSWTALSCVSLAGDLCPQTVPSTWNDLSLDISMTSLLTSFRSLFKCHLISEAYPDHPNETVLPCWPSLPT